MTEQTLLVVKPDGVRRGLVGTILARFEAKGLKIVELKMLTLSPEKARDFYSPHIGKHFFPELISFITSGPVVAAVLEGRGCVEVVRRMIGPTDSAEAPSGTIRGDFGLEITENLVHASDSTESFLRERRIIFD